MTKSNAQNLTSPQKCFIGYTERTKHSEDLLNACKNVLPESRLTPDYAHNHFDDTTLRQKALSLIKDCRYGLYDLSPWKDKQGTWRLPWNVLLELGMAIALNRQFRLFYNAGESGLSFPECLGQAIEFSGKPTLEEALRKNIKPWSDDQEYRSHQDCYFGHRTCEYRDIYPQIQGEEKICCYILDDNSSPDLEDFRTVIKNVLEKCNHLDYNYWDCQREREDLLFCRCCRKLRKSSFMLARITPESPAETFLAIGMSVALEDQGKPYFRVIMTKDEEMIPSLLKGHDLLIASNDSEKERKLTQYLPEVVEKIRGTGYISVPTLPFVDETMPSLASDEEPSLQDETAVLVRDDEPPTEEDIPFDEVTEILQRKREYGDYDVFLCHNGKDKDAVKKIGEALRQRGILPWLDEWDLRPGIPWQDAIEKQITEGKAVAVFFGPNGNGPWQTLEHQAFIREYVERRCPVIPVFLEEYLGKISDLPIFLQGIQSVDFRESVPDPFEQLVWGITGKKARGGGQQHRNEGFSADALSSLARELLNEIRQEKRDSLQGLTLLSSPPQGGWYMPYVWWNSEKVDNSRYPFRSFTDFIRIQHALEELVDKGFLDLHLGDPDRTAWYLLRTSAEVVANEMASVLFQDVQRAAQSELKGLTVISLNSQGTEGWYVPYLYQGGRIDVPRKNVFKVQIAVERLVRAGVLVEGRVTEHEKQYLLRSSLA